MTERTSNYKKHKNKPKFWYICKFIDVSIMRPQELTHTYAKPIIINYHNCLWLQDKVYYISYTSGRLCRKKMDKNVSILHTYSVDELENVDPRLIEKYIEYQASLPCRRGYIKKNAKKIRSSTFPKE